ncbi:F-box domain-containing protein [Mycena sanguinolenta]|uniref:F-box domain-containing protein n=1 Tax=Mycena sanguinolenta TaxID=230812 RepID=A0A8H7D7A3_9AGAR|nr:F-box domain-containing protein [Mycena sanguinolenta]
MEVRAEFSERHVGLARVPHAPLLRSVDSATAAAIWVPGACFRQCSCLATAVPRKYYLSLSSRSQKITIQMTTQELRERIAEVSSSIAHQEELLKKLRQDMSLLQRQLNEAVDPVARLPLEISSEIFLQCLDPFPSPGESHAPTLLLNVCNTWTRIALSTPALWASIHIELPNTQHWKRVLPFWFRRARNRSLSISLSGDLRYFSDRISSCIWKYASGLRHLLISDDSEDEDEDDEDGQLSITLFKNTPPDSLPSLETLTVRGFITDRVFMGPQIMELLLRAPNIIEYICDCMEVIDLDESTTPVVLPTLRRLIFGDDADDDILNHLSLPALETLSLSMCAVSLDDFLRFLKRSAPPLKELVMGFRYVTEDSGPLLECLSRIPTLGGFKMWGAHNEIMDHLLTALADSYDLLPNLHILTINTRTQEADIPDSFWGSLLRAISTRRIQLHLPGVKAPPEAVLAAFRQLVVDGIQIYIGSEESNLVAV